MTLQSCSVYLPLISRHVGVDYRQSFRKVATLKEKGEKVTAAA
jgi:hypothetical protein